MQKSHIQKKSEITNATFYGYGRISEWTKKELRHIQETSKEPIFLKLSDGNYRIATYLVKQVPGLGWQVDDLMFSDKRSAIYYCAFMHSGKKSMALKVLELDLRVTSLNLDKTLFRVRLDQAHLQNDVFKISLFESRFTEIKTRLALAKTELEKLCKTLNTLSF